MPDNVMFLCLCSSDDSNGFEHDLHQYQRQLEKRAKHVRFDDILDDSAPGHMGSIRRKLLKEDKKARFKTEVGVARKALRGEPCSRICIKIVVSCSLTLCINI